MEDKKKRVLLIGLVVFLLILAFGIVFACIMFSSKDSDAVVSNSTTKEIKTYIDALDVELSSSDLDGMHYLDELKDLKVETPSNLNVESSFVNINEKKVDSGSFEVKSGEDTETYYYLDGKFSSSEELGHD